jgi:hypothetical protein
VSKPQPQFSIEALAAMLRKSGVTLPPAFEQALAPAAEESPADERRIADLEAESKRLHDQALMKPRPELSPEVLLDRTADQIAQSDFDAERRARDLADVASYHRRHETLSKPESAEPR